jgi:hypothetical protein
MQGWWNPERKKLKVEVKMEMKAMKIPQKVPRL